MGSSAATANPIPTRGDDYMTHAQEAGHLSLQGPEHLHPVGVVGGGMALNNLDMSVKSLLFYCDSLICLAYVSIKFRIR